MTTLSSFNWVAALVAASAIIQCVEYLNRHLRVGFMETLMLTAPLIVAAQFGLWFGWRHATHAMLAWATFSLCNTLFRLGAVHFLYKDKLNVYHLVGVCFAIGAMICMKKGS